MKRLIPSVMALFLCLCSLFSQNVFAVPELSAGSAVVMHGDTGEILYQHDADERSLIASTTKIMTALVVIENCPCEEIVTIKPEYTGIEGSSMYLKSGEKISVLDLLYGLMLSSGNDAATALAYHCGGSIEGFSAMMNEKANFLGLKNTHFTNPHGLDGEEHYSTASELAIITREALRSDLFRKIVSTKTYATENRTFMNHNKLLWRCQGAIGVKTGYTMAAGRILVSAVMRDGMYLICVTLSDPDDWDDHMSLYDWAVSSYQYISPLPMGEICRIPVISGTAENVGVIATGDTSVLVKRDAPINYCIELPEFVYAGIHKGETAGKLYLTADGARMGEIDLVYSEDVPLAENARLTPWERLKKACFLVNRYGQTFGGGEKP